MPGRVRSEWPNHNVCPQPAHKPGGRATSRFIESTDSGGLSMVVSQQVKAEKKDEKTGEVTIVSEEKRCEVEADEWAYICSLKETSARK